MSSLLTEMRHFKSIFLSSKINVSKYMFQSLSSSLLRKFLSVGEKHRLQTKAHFSKD